VRAPRLPPARHSEADREKDLEQRVARQAHQVRDEHERRHDAESPHELAVGGEQRSLGAPAPTRQQ